MIAATEHQTTRLIFSAQKDITVNNSMLLSCLEVPAFCVPNERIH